jgi:hypothetical protein
VATKYVILKKDPDETSGEKLAVVGEAEGSSDLAAINVFLDIVENAEKYGEGDYRAVPARSWKLHPKRRKVSFV